MAESRYRGHKIECVNHVWIYSDTKEKVSDNRGILCGHCSKESTKEGHDACLGTLPGLMNACCGHGNIDYMYVQLLDGQTIRGEDAKTIIEILKRWRVNET